MKIFFTIAVVALATSSPVSSRADDQIRDASPDGKFAMSLKDIVDRGESRVKIELIEVSSGKTRLTLPTASVSCLSWTPDGKALACGHADGKMTLWDCETGKRDLMRPECGPRTALRRRCGARVGCQTYAVAWRRTGRQRSRLPSPVGAGQ